MFGLVSCEAASVLLSAAPRAAFTASWINADSFQWEKVSALIKGAYEEGRESTSLSGVRAQAGAECGKIGLPLF